MKKTWSIKARLTLLYTFFMTLLTCICLGILFSLSNQEVLSSVQTKLENQVYKGIEDVDADEEGLDIDSDFYDLEGGIYLSLYSREGEFLYGRSPYGFDGQAELKDGQLQKIRNGKQEWYIFDVESVLEGYGSVYIRGVTSVTEAEDSMRITLRFSLVLLPMLVIFIGIVGYRFTRRALLPVRKITDTVQEIRRDGDLSRRVGLGKGRDEIYTLSETFDQMLSQLEEAFNREKQFTSDVSHELRTPVTVILAQCGAMLEKEDLDEEQREQLCLIEKKAKDMAAMISHLLLLSRADQGRQRLQKEWLNLSELTEIAALEQELIARQKGIEIRREIQEDVFGEADESFFIRMLMNLISNGIYYNRAGGYVKVGLKREEDGILISVEDNGIGISPEALPHIWERFFREDTSRTDSGRSGLGLSMVKWIAKAHGGSVFVRSKKGEGSSFLVKWPVKGGEEEKGILEKKS